MCNRNHLNFGLRPPRANALIFFSLSFPIIKLGITMISSDCLVKMQSLKFGGYSVNVSSLSPLKTDFYRMDCGTKSKKIKCI